MWVEGCLLSGGVRRVGGGGSVRQACRRRQCHRPPAGRTGISPGWPLAVISLHRPASPQVLGSGCGGVWGVVSVTRH